MPGHVVIVREIMSARVFDYERTLAIFEKRLGPDHPDTKTVRDNLASLSKDE